MINNITLKQPILTIPITRPKINQSYQTHKNTQINLIILASINLKAPSTYS